VTSRYGSVAADQGPRSRPLRGAQVLVFELSIRISNEWKDNSQTPVQCLGPPPERR
jgi:hypothetical protein